MNPDTLRQGILDQTEGMQTEAGACGLLSRNLISKGYTLTSHKVAAPIHHADALEIDWNAVLPAAECSSGVTTLA